MSKWIDRIVSFAGWMTGERVKDYRENKTRIYDAIVKTNTQINQIILTSSVAGLAAIAALNKNVFVPYGGLSFIVVSSFILTIFASVVNLYITSRVLIDLQRQLNKNHTSFSRLDEGMDKQRFHRLRKALNAIVFVGFCFGIVMFVILLGLYILGVQT